MNIYKYKHDLYIRIGDENYFVNKIYTMHNCSIKIQSNIHLSNIVNSSVLLSKVQEDCHPFTMKCLDSNRATKILFDFLSLNCHLAATFSIDTSGTIGFMTRLVDQGTECGADSLSFRCYFIRHIDSVKELPLTFASQGKRKSSDICSSRPDSPHEMFDDRSIDFADEILQQFYESLMEELRTQQTVNKRFRLEPKSLMSGVVSGQAPDLHAIVVNEEISRKFGDLRETDETRIASRLKQILYGKNTTGYDNYITAVPKAKRSASRKDHPRTPDPHLKVSKRAFDGIIKSWRRSLHQWDSVDKENEDGSANKLSMEKTPVFDAKNEFEMSVDDQENMLLDDEDVL